MLRQPTQVAVLTVVGSILLLGTVQGHTALTPFDFSGHWSACAGEPQTLWEGCFAARGAREFKGTLTVQTNTPEQCTGRVKGTRKTKRAVLLRFHCDRPCDQGPGVGKLNVRLKGQLDVGDETITGVYTSTAKGCGKRQASTGHLVLTRADAPSPCGTPTTTSTTIPSGPCTFLLKWGVHSGDRDGELASPVSVAADASGHVYVVDDGNARIQKFDASGGFLAKWGSAGGGDGQFIYPSAVAADASDNVYVADAFAHRIQKFDTNGTFLTTWGSYGSANGQFENAVGIATDASGDVYVADTYRIQKFDATGTFLTTWGSYGSGDGQFINPAGVATDGSGHVYVVDWGNDRVQKFDAVGTFLVTWGSYGSGDGQFVEPLGVATDASGNVYIADAGNTRVQKVDADGTFLTTWGNDGSANGQVLGPGGGADHGG